LLAGITPLVIRNRINRVWILVAIEIGRKISLLLEIQERFKLLTILEREVMAILVKNYGRLTSQQIADELGISKRTTEVHRSNIMGKMLAKTRSELVE